MKFLRQRPPDYVTCDGSDLTRRHTGVSGKCLRQDDQAREFDYGEGAEKSLELAKTQKWTVVSIKNDWKEVFHSLDRRSRAVS